jgi:AcrR family transcriptional regulator
MAGDVVRVPQQRKPSRMAEVRRRDLIDAAIGDIATPGYDAVAVATIGERAGFSRGLIGHYFAGKDDLLLEAVMRVAADLGIVLDPDRTALGFLQLVQRFRETSPISPTTASGLLPPLVGFHLAAAA